MEFVGKVLLVIWIRFAAGSNAMPSFHQKWQYGDNFVSLAEFDTLRHPYIYNRLRDEELLVLVMASKILDHRVSKSESYLRHYRVRRLYLVDDWIDSVSRKMQWRSGSSHAGDEGGGLFGGPVHESYWDAQSRQLEYMSKFPFLEGGILDGVKWVLLADDDTWVHVERLLAFCGAYDSKVPALFSYVLSSSHVAGYDYPCGGAGMLLSAGAYVLLAPRLLTPACPLLSFNDLTLGFCAHAHGVPVIHHPGMHCLPDINKAKRPTDNFMDLHAVIAMHRLPAMPGFDYYIENLAHLDRMREFLLENGCRMAARIRELSGSDFALDSRLFEWSADVFPDLVESCRNQNNAENSRRRPGTADPIHMHFVFFGGNQETSGVYPWAHIMAKPSERGARWPDWMEQLRAGGCGSLGAERFKDTWSSRWLGSVPRISRVQLMASDVVQLGEITGLRPDRIQASFSELEEKSPRGSWLDEFRRSHRYSKRSHPLQKSKPGRHWVFLNFEPATTFVNVAESARVLRTLSSLHRDDSSETPMADVRGIVDLGAEDALPLAVAHVYASVNVEQSAGLWLNGVAANRLFRCPTQKHPIFLDEALHEADLETEEERLATFWRNAVAIDVLRTIRQCGLLLLHAYQMVPIAQMYLTYSTYRRAQASQVTAAMTVGCVVSQEQLHSMSLMLRQRACQLHRRVNASVSEFSAGSQWKPHFQLRMLFRGRAKNVKTLRNETVPADREEELVAVEERQWQLPGARIFGRAYVVTRSEHFLPDAQAA